MVQYLFLAPGNLDKNGILDALNAAFPPGSGEQPIAQTMPGTRQFNGKSAVHTTRDVTQEELQGAVSALNSWQLIAIQEFDFVGSPTLPVPLNFIDWIESKFDSGGGAQRPTHPTSAPHTFAGARPWVWAEL